MRKNQVAGMTALVAVITMIGVLVLISGCSPMLAGTKSAPSGSTFASIEQAGEIRGVEIADGKDRQAFDTGSRTTDETGCQPPANPERCHRVTKEFWLKTADSNGSNAQAAAYEAQAKATDKLATTVEGLVNTFLPVAKPLAK